MSDQNDSGAGEASHISRVNIALLIMTIQCRHGPQPGAVTLSELQVPSAAVIEDHTWRPANQNEVCELTIIATSTATVRLRRAVRHRLDLPLTQRRALRIAKPLDALIPIRHMNGLIAGDGNGGVPSSIFHTIAVDDLYLDGGIQVGRFQATVP